MDNKEEKELTFFVERCSSSIQEAQYFAAFRAKDIIHHIRKVLHGKSPSRGKLPDVPRMGSCSALKLGSELCALWRSTKYYVAQSPNEWNKILTKLEEFVIDYPQFAVLLKYYEVIAPSIWLM